MNDETPVRLTN